MSLPLVTSSILPARFVHGFTTRAGGVSKGLHESLNVGFKWGDDPACVRENRRRVQVASGAESLFLARQVHGNRVYVVKPDDGPSHVAEIEADALVVARAGSAAAVIVADCVPILLADPNGGACAAVHAGWRGTAADVAGEAARALAHAGANLKAVRAVIGPSIGPCCFEVGDEVVHALRGRLAGPENWHAQGPRGRPHVDLWEVNRALLQAAGLLPEHIEVLGACTHCEADRFFSYRRQGAATGQMMAFVRAAGPAAA